MVGVEPTELVENVCHSVFCPADEDNCPMQSLKRMNQFEHRLLTVDGREVPILKTAVKAKV